MTAEPLSDQQISFIERARGLDDFDVPPLFARIAADRERIAELEGRLRTASRDADERIAELEKELAEVKGAYLSRRKVEWLDARHGYDEPL